MYSGGSDAPGRTLAGILAWDDARADAAAAASFRDGYVVDIEGAGVIEASEGTCREQFDQAEEGFVRLVQRRQIRFSFQSMQPGDVVAGQSPKHHLPMLSSLSQR